MAGPKSGRVRAAASGWLAGIGLLGFSRPRPGVAVHWWWTPVVDGRAWWTPAVLAKRPRTRPRPRPGAGLRGCYAQPPGDRGGVPCYRVPGGAELCFGGAPSRRGLARGREERAPAAGETRAGEARAVSSMRRSGIPAVSSTGRPAPARTDRDSLRPGPGQAGPRGRLRGHEAAGGSTRRTARRVQRRRLDSDRPAAVLTGQSPPPPRRGRAGRGGGGGGGEEGAGKRAQRRRLESAYRPRRARGLFLPPPPPPPPRTGPPLPIQWGRGPISVEYAEVPSIRSPLSMRRCRASGVGSDFR